MVGDEPGADQSDRDNYEKWSFRRKPQSRLMSGLDPGFRRGDRIRGRRMSICAAKSADLIGRLRPGGRYGHLPLTKSFSRPLGRLQLGIVSAAPSSETNARKPIALEVSFRNSSSTRSVRSRIDVARARSNRRMALRIASSESSFRERACTGRVRTGFSFGFTVTQPPASNRHIMNQSTFPRGGLAHPPGGYPYYRQTCSKSAQR